MELKLSKFFQKPLEQKMRADTHTNSKIVTNDSRAS